MNTSTSGSSNPLASGCLARLYFPVQSSNSAISKTDHFPDRPRARAFEGMLTYDQLVLEKGFTVSAGRKTLITLLVLIGLILIAVGIVYFVVKAGSLPSFIPGHIANSSAHRSKRGLVAVIVGAVVLLVAVVGASVGRRR